MIHQKVVCPAGYKLNSFKTLCYPECDPGYEWNARTPTACVPSNTNRGLFYTQNDTVKPACPSGTSADIASGIDSCYPPCPSGSNPLIGTGPTCVGPRGQRYTTATSTLTTTSKPSTPATCSSGTPDQIPNDITGLCYQSCGSGNSHVAGVPTQCQGARGMSYRSTTSVPTIITKPT